MAEKSSSIRLLIGRSWVRIPPGLHNKYNWEIILDNNPDKLIPESGKIAISSVVWILDNSKAWCNMVRHIVDEHIPQKIWWKATYVMLNLIQHLKQNNRDSSSNYAKMLRNYNSSLNSEIQNNKTYKIMQIKKGALFY